MNSIEIKKKPLKMIEGETDAGLLVAMWLDKLFS